MTNSLPRIDRGIKGFADCIETTCRKLLELSEPPLGRTNGTRYGWKPTEILDWCDFKTRWDVLMPLYNNKKGTRTTEVTEGLHLIIKEAIAYDKKHQLYNRIASCPDATIDDFIAFNIVRGTPLASGTHARAAAPGTKTVTIALKKSSFLMHQLLVTTPDHKGRGKEDGVKDILIYRAVALITAGVPALNLYQYVGDVHRGLINVNHEDTTQGMRAWYIGRVKNSLGELGEPSEPVGFIII